MELKIRLGVVLPVLDDRESCQKLLEETDLVLSDLRGIDSAHVIVVDDGSSLPLRSKDFQGFRNGKVEVERLDPSRGHQEAIFRGLSRALDLNLTHYLIMDSDGEDSPRDFERLFRVAVAEPSVTVVAKRGLRTESLKFRFWYRVHRILFRLLTGRELDFGNFMILPQAIVARVLATPTASSHLPSTLLKLGVPLNRVRSNRAQRYFGGSKMNFENLVEHSFAGIRVFYEKVMVRLLVASFLLTAMVSVGLATVVGIRLFYEPVLPGWATTASGLLFVVFVQSLSFLCLTTIVALNGRNRN